MLRVGPPVAPFDVTVGLAVGVGTPADFEDVVGAGVAFGWAQGLQSALNQPWSVPRSPGEHTGQMAEGFAGRGVNNADKQKQD